MKKDEIYKFLKNIGVKFKLDNHKAVFSMGELDDESLKYPNRQSKNLFLKDRKKQNYYLITVLGDKRVNLKEFSNKFKTKRLSFATPDELFEILNLTPGSVTPFGILNDKNNKVECFLDSEFMLENHIIGVHPNDNTATIWLKTDDLVKIIKNHGNKISVVNL